jgi:5-oxoprolinase (ATP-hydrolysing)
MAASQCTMNNFTFGNATHQYYETISGGSGAGPGLRRHQRRADPHDQLAPHRPRGAGVPLPGAAGQLCHPRRQGGAGRWRGGDGGVRRVRFLEPMTASILSNGRHPAFGMAGGQPGALGINRVERADGRVSRWATSAR